MDTARFLLEIGTEEIPARFLLSAREELKFRFKDALERYNLKYGNIVTYATPRRLSIIIEDIDKFQKGKEILIFGPPKRIAFDHNGEPTKAAIGFAKKMGVDISDLEYVEKDKGEYLAYKKKEKDKSTKDILSRIVPDIILALSFPKRMRWGKGELSFARPIHWLLALFDNEVVDFSIGSEGGDQYKSGKNSFGHRFMSPGSIPISHSNEYEDVMEKVWVMVDPEKRKENILSQMQNLIKDKNLTIIKDDELLEEVVYLVEYPFCILGNFDESFLELPEVVLITSMKEHQRYFSLRTKDKRLAPYFISINNTKAKDMNVVQRGHERVLKARLEDARFFFQEDLKISLDKRVEELKGVVFHSRLGTSYEKMIRFQKLALYLADMLNSAIKEEVKRVAWLCKADLVTEMVGEFPSLQGIMGKEYAIRQGEDKIIAEAIEQHYWPRFAGDTLPQIESAALVGMADRLDSLLGFFLIGEIPTGTADPFALRRHALAVIGIIIDRNYKIKLRKILEYHLENMPVKTEDPQKVIENLISFMVQRWQNKVISEGNPTDLVNAVAAVEPDDFVSLERRLASLGKFRDKDEFETLVLLFKRVQNILKKSEDEPIFIKDFLIEEAEKELFEHVERVKDEIEKGYESDDYSSIIVSLLALGPYIAKFFDDVLVMSPDENIRKTRLGLLNIISDLFFKIADLNKISTR